jgi:hypothetical protein
LIALGYGISALARPFYALASEPAPRGADPRERSRGQGPARARARRDGGLRRPRKADRGHAFGFHRMMDNFGGVARPILAFLLLRAVDLPLRTVFAASIVPGLAAVLVILIFVKELPRARGAFPPEPSAASAERLHLRARCPSRPRRAAT